MLRRLSLAALLWFAPALALAQSSPGLTTGQVPTAAQWNSYFAAKQDFLGFTPLNPSTVLGSPPVTVTTGAGTLTIGLASIAAGHVIGNGTGSPTTAADASLSSVMDQALCLTANAVAVRGALNWQCATSANGALYNTNASGVPTITPTPAIGVNGGTGGAITFNGATSGSAVIQVAAAAGSGIVFQLPSTNGTNGFVLSTNGSGVLSWIAAGGTGTVTSVTCGTGLTGGTFSTTGTCAADLASNAQIWGATSNKIVEAGNINASQNLVTLTDAATIAVDMSTFINGTVTLGGNRTLGAPTNTQAGRSGCIFVVQDGTGTRTLAYNAVWKFQNAVAPVLSTAPNAVDMLCYVVRDSTHIIASIILGVT